MLKLEDNILINQWVQGVQNTTAVLNWFESGSIERKSEILRYLVALCRQAKASDEDGMKAISESTLNPRRSASVLLAKGANVEILNKLSGLRKADGQDSFLLLLHLLRVADHRRREAEIPGSCHHWWHRDLGDEAVLQEVRSSHAKGMRERARGGWLI